MKRKPEWLRVKIGNAKNIKKVNTLLDTLELNTVCQEANCPNRLECFNKNTATFMILGSICSRNCNFCDVQHGVPQTVNPEEPMKIANAVKTLSLKHAVITSVTRDDLDDGGAKHFRDVVQAIRKENPSVKIELLIPDLQGDLDNLKTILGASPDIINHNVETIERLYEAIRPQADYMQSLRLIKNVKKINPSVITKSGIMVGLGETQQEVTKVLKDLRAHGCDLLTIGQYLQPSPMHYPMKDYIHPNTFKKYEEIAYGLGFKDVASGPMVRSSYNASEMLY